MLKILFYKKKSLVILDYIIYCSNSKRIRMPNTFKIVFKIFFFTELYLKKNYILLE